jgi:uncharacterized protein YprB with RNaseH-like and TPR domain
MPIACSTGSAKAFAGLAIERREQNMSAKILIFDIECYTHDFAADKGYLLCIGYKWLGDKKVGMIRPKNMDAFRRDPTNDKAMCQEFLKLVEQADIVAGWNSKSFDWRFLQTRILKHRLGYLPPVPHCDLLLTSRATTKMRRSLDNTGKFFGLKNQKVPLNIDRWMAAGRGDDAALREIIAHCVSDVLMTEEAYRLFAPMSRVHPNVALINGNQTGCPLCATVGSLQQRGKIHALRHYRLRYHCQKCGRWSTSGEIKYKKGDKK